MMSNDRLEEPVGPMALAGLVLTGIAGAGALGAVTNAINGIISPQYFVAILRWEILEKLDQVWRVTAAIGLLQGLVFGMFLSLIFGASTGVITRASVSYRYAVVYLMGILGGAFVGWFLGGLAGVGLAALSPEFFRQAFIGVPKEYGPMLAFAWVGGSIWGVLLGGFGSVVLAIVLLRANWLRRSQS